MKINLNLFVKSFLILGGINIYALLHNKKHVHLAQPFKIFHNVKLILGEQYFN